MLLRFFCHKSIRNRLVSMFLVLALCISGMCISVEKQEKKASAFAVVDDLTALGIIATVVIGAVTAGAAVNEIVTTKENKGITDIGGMTEYVKKGFENSGIDKYLDSASSLWDSACIKMAEVMFNTKYLLDMDFFAKAFAVPQPVRRIRDTAQIINQVYLASRTITPNNNDDDDDDDEDALDEADKQELQRIHNSEDLSTQPLYESVMNNPQNMLPKYFPQYASNLDLFYIIVAAVKAMTNQAISDDEKALDNTDFDYSIEAYKSIPQKGNIHPFFKYWCANDMLVGGYYSLGFAHSQLVCSAYQYPMMYEHKWLPVLVKYNLGYKFGLICDYDYQFDPNLFFSGYLDWGTKGFINVNSSNYDNFFIYRGRSNTDLQGVLQQADYGNSRYFGDAYENVSNIIDAIDTRSVLDPAKFKVDCDKCFIFPDEISYENWISEVRKGKSPKKEYIKLKEDGWKYDPDKVRESYNDKGTHAKEVVDDPKYGGIILKPGLGTDPHGKPKPIMGTDLDAIVGGLINGVPLTGEVVSVDNPIVNPEAEIDPVPEPDIKPEPEPEPEPTPNPTNKPSPSPSASPLPSPTPQKKDEDGPTVPIVPSGDDNGINWYERFPFCIPYDVYYAISSLNQKVKVPSWDIPVKLDKVGVNETVHIDFHWFEDIRIFVQWFIRIGVLLGLALITRSIIKG